MAPRTIFRRGFTLIEVLVVVAILGILAAIVVPRIMDRPDEAKRVAAKAESMRRTSATGIRALTLIEVPVVLAIVGVVIAVVAPNLFPGNIEASRRQGAAVALAIERARDDAWFGGKPTAVSFGDGRLR